MPLPGGQSTAAGVAYQATAVARYLLDVYQGTASSLKAEPPPKASLAGSDLTDVMVNDFIVVRPQGREYYEAKMCAPGGGQWTVKKLLREDVLQHFLAQCQADSTGICTLITESKCELLGEIANGARDRKLNEFIESLNQKQLTAFRQACLIIKTSSEQMHALLRHCHTQCLPESSIMQLLRGLATDKFVDPVGAVDSLRNLALDAMKRGHELDRDKIEAYLAERACFRRPNANEETLLEAVRNASSALRLTGATIAGVQIPRKAIDEMYGWVTGPKTDGTSVAVLLDQAGSGKSAALAILLRRLEGEGYRVLGLKVDALPEYGTLQQLAEATVLPDLAHSTLAFLAAKGHKVALLVDQVDALSSAMARDDAAIRVIADLVARVSFLRGLPVVLSCRAFDWEYDVRLQPLRARHPKQFSLQKLNDEQVNMVLQRFGLSCKDVHPSSLSLLRCPQHLDVFARIVEDERTRDPAWSPKPSAIYSLQTLYERLWNLKMRKAKQAGFDSAQVLAITEMLAESMRGRQHLSAPIAILDASLPTRDWMISEGLLHLDGRQIRFFHQTFFDFVAARQFVRAGTSLVGFLLGTDQGLFFRSMVRQVLEYLRGADKRAYLAEMRRLIGEPRVRRHIRTLSLKWMGQLPDPTEDELQLIEHMFEEQGNRAMAFAFVARNAAWLRLLGAHRFQRWLESGSEEEVNSVIWYLAGVFEHVQSEVVPLLSPHAGTSVVWNNRIIHCLSGLNKWEASSSGLLLLVLRSPLTNTGQGGSLLASALNAQAKDSPKEACISVDTILGRFSARWEEYGRRDSKTTDDICARWEDEKSLLPRDWAFWDAIKTLADSESEQLLTVLLTYVSRWSRMTAKGESTRLFGSSAIGLPYSEHMETADPPERLGYAIKRAFLAIAERNPDAFRRLALVAAEIPDQVVQSIIADAYASCAEEYQTDAARFLLADTRRFHLGPPDAPMWSGRQLIKRCSPYWSDEDHRSIELAVRNLPHAKFDELCELKWYNQDRLELLSALKRERLTPEGLNLIGQLECKFPGYTARKPQDVGMDFVGPPIPKERLGKMSDKGWLIAMKGVTGDGGPHRWDKPTGLSGGRIQLSRVLHEVAKEQPDRFLRFASQTLSDAFHPDYISAIITGIAEAKAPLDLTCRLIRKFVHGLGGNAREICNALGKYAGENIPEDMLAMVEHWALEAPDPRVDDAPRVLMRGTSEKQNALLTEGINTDRGAAVWVLGELLLKSQPRKATRFLSLAGKGAGDPSLAVRAVWIYFLGFAADAEPTQACAIFRRLVAGHSPLLREHGAQSFVYYTYYRNYDDIRWAIEQMLADKEDAHSRQAGARLATLAAFSIDPAKPLRDACLTAGVPERMGIAQVYSANVNNSRLREECKAALRCLWRDENSDVRAKASDFWAHIEPHDLGELGEFVREWSKSPAFHGNEEDAARVLHEYPLANRSLTLDIADRVFESVGKKIGDFSSGQGMLSFYLTPAILNIYRQEPNTSLRSRAMNLFEKLEEFGAHEVHKAMEDADRL